MTADLPPPDPAAVQAVAFDQWIDRLREDVIEGEYGYEPGEFTVYRDHWRSMFRQGLSPSGAFKRALDAHGDARKQEDADQADRWAAIQAQDAAAINAYRAHLAELTS